MLVVFIGLLAVMMFAIGQWGRKRAATLVPPSLSTEEREKRARVYKRGAVVLQLTAVAFVLVVCVGMVRAASGH
jgi:hypothetical protein